MKQRIEKLINYILSQKESELSGIYNSQMERMVAEHDMELKNDVIDDIVFIIRDEFKDLEDYVREERPYDHVWDMYYDEFEDV